MSALEEFLAEGCEESLARLGNLTYQQEQFRVESMRHSGHCSRERRHGPLNEGLSDRVACRRGVKHIKACQLLRAFGEIAAQRGFAAAPDSREGRAFDGSC